MVGRGEVGEGGGSGVVDSGWLVVGGGGWWWEGVVSVVRMEVAGG